MRIGELMKQHIEKEVGPITKDEFKVCKAVGEYMLQKNDYTSIIELMNIMTGSIMAYRRAA